MATAVVLPAIHEPSPLEKIASTVTTTSITPPPSTTPKPQFSWQRGPIPLITTPLSSLSATETADQYTLAASEMALVHNCIIRALNCIYVQTPHLPTSEVTNFLHFSEAVYKGLCAHHDGEEQHFFPELEQITGEKGLMEGNVEQHREFDAKFDAWGAWVRSCLVGKEEWTAHRNRELMDAFVPPLSTHLHDEIPSILSLRRFGDQLDLAAMFKAEGEKVMGGMCKTSVLPVFFFNHDDGFEEGRHNFPPLPGVVKWVLKNVFGRVNGGWWKFAACGMDGRAREVPFLG